MLAIVAECDLQKQAEQTTSTTKRITKNADLMIPLYYTYNYYSYRQLTIGKLCTSLPSHHRSTPQLEHHSQQSQSAFLLQALPHAAESYQCSLY